MMDCDDLQFDCWRQLWTYLPRRAPVSLSAACRTSAAPYLCQTFPRHRLNSVQCLISSLLPPPIRQQLIDDCCSTGHLPEAALVRVLNLLIGGSARAGSRAEADGCGLWSVWLREPLLTPCVRAALYMSLWRCGGDQVTRLRLPQSTASSPVHGELQQLSSLLSTMCHLTELSLPHLSVGGRQLCSALATGCPYLQRLDLQQSAALDDACLMFLLYIPSCGDNCREASPCASNLLELHLTGCERVTRDGLTAALRACGQLQALHHQRIVCAVCELHRQQFSNVATMESSTVDACLGGVSQGTVSSVSREETSAFSVDGRDMLVDDNSDADLRLEQLWQPESPHSSCCLADAVARCTRLRRLVCGQLHRLEPISHCLTVLSQRCDRHSHALQFRELSLYRLDVDASLLGACLAENSCSRYLSHLCLSFCRTTSLNLAPVLTACWRLQLMEISGCSMYYSSGGRPSTAAKLRQLRLQTPVDTVLLSVEDTLIPLVAAHGQQLSSLHVQWLSSVHQLPCLSTLVPVSCQRLVLAGGQLTAHQLASLLSVRPALCDVSIMLPTSGSDQEPFHALALAAARLNLAVNVRVLNRRLNICRQLSSLSMDS